jgi:NADPH2:quinone reductase
MTSVPTTMNAICVTSFGGPEVLKVRNITIPKLKPGQVLVRVHAAGVNPVETYIRAGTYARLPPLPWTPGNDGAGVIVAVCNANDTTDQSSSSAKNNRSSSPTSHSSNSPSSTASKSSSPSSSTASNTSSPKQARSPSSPSSTPCNTIKIGCRVWMSGSITGTYAQYCVCNLSQVHHLPESIDAAQGASIGIAYRTAYRALHLRAKVRAGQIVLIHGASGGVGLAAVQLAAAHGCIVYGTAGTEEGMKLIKEHGCDYAFNHRQKGYMDDIYETTGKREGVDVILEMLANVNLNEDLKIMARGGVVAVIGNRGNVEINPRLLMQKESSVLGVLGGTPEEHQQCFAGINAGLKSGAINPVVATPAYMMEQASIAHTSVMDDTQGSAGKVVLITK